MTVEGGQDALSAARLILGSNKTVDLSIGALEQFAEQASAKEAGRAGQQDGTGRLTGRARLLPSLRFRLGRSLALPSWAQLVGAHRHRIAPLPLKQLPEGLIEQ